MIIIYALIDIWFSTGKPTTGALRKDTITYIRALGLKLTRVDNEKRICVQIFIEQLIYFI